MGKHEHPSLPKEQPNAEIFDPHHLYAAYVFDSADEREQDIESLIEQAKALGYPLRYWWLSDGMDLEGYPDRLIVCVHHPSSSEDAGCDLYDVLKERGVTWNDMEAALVEEYLGLGKPVREIDDLRSSEGDRLFPSTVTKKPHP